MIGSWVKSPGMGVRDIEFGSSDIEFRSSIIEFGLSNVEFALSKIEFRSSVIEFRSSVIGVSLKLNVLLWLERTFVSRWAVNRRHWNIVQPQINAELRPVVDIVVHHEAPQGGYSRNGEDGLPAR